VLGAGLVLVVLVLMAVAVQLAAVVITRHRAQAAADLAALASATDAVAGQLAACRAARDVAERMATELTGCELDGWDAVVRVSARPPGLVERWGTVRAAARAGPVPADQLVHDAVGAD